MTGRVAAAVAVAVSMGTTPAAAHSPSSPVPPSPHLLTSPSPHLPSSPVPQLPVFLHDGTVVFSHGECAALPGELVCVVRLEGGDGHVSHDLLTLPIARVDLERTMEYVRAVRAAHYGATRGEREFAELTASLARALEELRSSTDRDRQLGIALVARRRLASWSADHFGYRADETRDLVSLLDEVIAELRLAAGDRTFAFDLVATPPPAPPVPLRSSPSPDERLSAALAAAGLTEVAAERLAILRSAQRAAAALPGVDATLRARVAAALDAEEALERRYRALIDEVTTRADEAVRRGRPAVVRQLLREVETRHVRLGGRRTREVAALTARLQIELEQAMAQQEAFARWTQIRAQLFAYEVRVRPVFGAWDHQRAVLEALRHGQPPRPAALDAAVRRFGSAEALLDSLRPLPELAASHALLQSAVRLARQGLTLGQRLAVAPNADIARNASAAVAGADLLVGQARADLIVALNPRRVR